MSLQRGAKARLTADTPEGWHDPRAKGYEFVVEELMPALKEGDEGYGEPDHFVQVAYYLGNSRHGICDVEAPADIVEEVMTARDMSQRKLPTPTEVARALQGEALGVSNAGFELDETSGTPDGRDTFECYGETDEGLPFGIEVKVLRVFHTDF